MHIFQRKTLHLERADVGELACQIAARHAALVGGGSRGVIGMADGGAAGQQGHRFRGAAIVLQRAQAGIIDTEDIANPVGEGGGLFVNTTATATLTNCTLSLNYSFAGSGGGIYVTSGGILNLTNTIVAGNTAGAGPDIFGAVATADHNLVGNATGSTGIVNGVNGNILGGNGNPVINALLGPLQNNGGPTKTMALLAGSPAIGTADNAAAPATDQRGVTRRDLAGELTDIGAFEV